MKRPILVAVIGYIIGILTGLYFKFSIVLLYLILISITVLYKLLKIIYTIIENKNYKKIKKKKFSFYSITRYLRYFKLILNRKVIITFIIFSCLSNLIVIEKNKQFEEFYRTREKVEIVAKINSNVEEKEYKNTYIIEVLEINKFKKNIYLYLNTNKDKILKFGDKVKIKGKYKAPSVQRNYGGFSYREYLKTLNIYGNVTAEHIEVIQEAKENNINNIINNLKESVKENAKKYLDNEYYSIYLGLILGDTTFIEDNTKDAFRDSNMGHILAVSGMHITYIVIGIVLFLGKISGKKFAKIICILSLIFYMIITGFSPSIIRACSMAIILLLSAIINRKADMWTSIGISLFIILIYNPFLITNVGLQYSYLGTLGIVLLNKNVLKLLITKKHNKESKIKKIIAVSISAQIFILPITLVNFNTIGIYFLITNLLLSLLIGPLIMLGFGFLILLLFNFPIASIIAIPIKIGIKILLLLTNISNWPLAKIYIATPPTVLIILYYLLIIIMNFVYSSLKNKSPSNSDLRIKYMLQLFKYNFRKYKKKVISSIIIITLLPFGFFILNKNDLKIHFVDVGQGDCCFIETPQNKTILIDGGGTEFGDYDVGKNTLLPYILDRGYTTIDYIIISHMDEDHVERFINYYERIKS